MSEAKDNQNQPKSSFRSYYEILGISRTATPEEIQRGFRASALATHPDHHREDPDATRKFQIVNEANQVLSDPLKRLAYDRRLPDLEEDWRRERQADLERQRREEAERRAQQKEQERKEKARMAEEQRKAETARAKAERDKIKDEERIAEEKKIRTQGRELGERLSYWFNTEDGRTQRVKDVDLLVRAQRKALGIEGLFRSREFILDRVGSILNAMGINGNLDSAGVVGNKLYTQTRKILLELDGKDDASYVRMEKLEQRLRDYFAANRYGKSNNDGDIPDTVKHVDSHLVNSFSRHPNDRKIYVQAFKSGWTMVKNGSRIYTWSE